VTTPPSRGPAFPQRPRILYATTREATYPRNATLVSALGDYADVEVVAPGGSGRGFDQRIAYLWGLARVVVRVLIRAISRSRRRDTLVIGFLAQPLAAVVRPLWKGRIIADAMVSVYDTVCEDKQLVSPRSPAGRLARWLDRQLVRGADGLLFDTRQHLDYFRTLSDTEMPTACVVPVGARRLAPPLRPRIASARLQVVFAGSYIPLQGTDVIVEAARRLRDAPVDVTMIGTGQELPAARQLAREHDLGRLRFVGWVDVATLDDWYHQADVILGIFGRTPKTRRVVPNKVFEALSIGQPVITGDTPAIREILEPGLDVICCPVDDPAGLADAIRWAHGHREQLREIGRAGRRAFEQHASARAIAEALRPLFDEGRA
jgi:glycosyltransferase involved in cell wall biosynthesis